MNVIEVGKCPPRLQDMVSLSSLVSLRSGLRSADTDEITYTLFRTRNVALSWVNVRFPVPDPLHGIHYLQGAAKKYCKFLSNRLAFFYELRNDIVYSIRSTYNYQVLFNNLEMTISYVIFA